MDPYQKLILALEPDVSKLDPSALGMAKLSIAISLKRIADVVELFGDHPDNRNAYGESGMGAVIGELGRFKNEVITDVSSMLHRRG